MAKTRLSETATFVERGYGQVEPNHLSAQRTGQIYAQLPAATAINVLENGQFVKYDYANGEVNFTGPGEWMLVFNEVKVYRDWESDADFAMIKDYYNARVYSPIDGRADTATGAIPMNQQTQPRYYGGGTYETLQSDGTTATVSIPKVTTPADPYEWDSTDNPFAATWDYKGPQSMKEGTKMVPRVFKTNIGDIYTTNCLISATSGVPAYPAIGDTFAPNEGGYLAPSTATTGMLWQVVKQYDLGDRQKAVKLMRIA